MAKLVDAEAQVLFRTLLRQARLSSRLTQLQVAIRLGRHQSFVTKYEIGERRLDVLEFVLVARALDADPVDLLEALIRQLPDMPDQA